MSQRDEILKVLTELHSENPDLVNLGVVSLDGLPIAAVLSEGMEEDRTAALSATILSLGERATAELKKGKLEQAYVKGEDGYVIVTGIKNIAALYITTTKSAKLGLVMLSIKKGTEKLSQIL